MADKNVGSLFQATQVNDDDLFVLEQGGEAKSLPGHLLKQYARQGVDALVAAAHEAAAQAEEAAKTAEKAVESVQGAADEAARAEAAAKAAAAAAQAAESAREAAAAAAQAAASDAVAGVDKELAVYVTAAQAAQAAAEQARDEAQSIAGGDFASKAYVDNKAEVAEDNAKAYTDERLKDADFDVTADEVTFADGETFQQKYDNGELNGTPGNSIISVDVERVFSNVHVEIKLMNYSTNLIEVHRFTISDGDDATINGVNTLTVEAGDGIAAIQDGDVLTIKAKTAEEWTFTLEDGSTVTKKVVLV